MLEVGQNMVGAPGHSVKNGLVERGKELRSKLDIHKVYTRVDGNGEERPMDRVNLQRLVRDGLHVDREGCVKVIIDLHQLILEQIGLEGVVIWVETSSSFLKLNPLYDT
jgi:hypothetical protein